MGLQKDVRNMHVAVVEIHIHVHVVVIVVVKSSDYINIIFEHIQSMINNNNICEVEVPRNVRHSKSVNMTYSGAYGINIKTNANSKRKRSD